MTYYIGAMPVGDHLEHHGIKGMRWGQRRFQNDDGSLTAAGRLRYGYGQARAWGQRTAKNASRSANKAYKSAVKGTKRAGKNVKGFYKKHKKAIKIGAGVAAAAGAAYLGYKYRNQIGAAARKVGAKAKAAKINRAQRESARQLYYKTGISNARFGDQLLKGDARLRYGMARGMAASKVKSAGRGVSNAFGKVKNGRIVTGARMAGYEALGRADNAAQSVRRAAKSVGNVRTRAGMMRGMAASKVKSAGRGISNAVKRSRITTGARMAGYEVLGRADNAAAFIRRNGASGVAKKVVKTAVRNPVKTAVAVGAATKGYKYIKRRKARKAASK